MKTQCAHHRRSNDARPRRPRERGILLIECLVYISVCFLVVGMASAAFYQAWDFSKHLRRNTAQIALALDAGERWRADIRSSTAPPHLEKKDSCTELHLPRAQGEVVYLFQGDLLLRQPQGRAEAVKVLSGLRSSTFIEETRQHVQSWRWELEFDSELKTVHLQPKFSFQAALGKLEARQ